MDRNWIVRPVAGFVAALALLVAVPGGPTSAGSNVVKVVPTGDPSQDVPNIRDALSAVAEGGTVLLRARDAQGNPTAFNFGQEFLETVGEDFALRHLNSVNIRKSVRIRGETLDDGIWDDDDDDGEDLDDEVRTTVEGGVEPFRVLEPGIDVVIEGIDFTCTRFKVISVIAGNRVVIKNNRFGKVTFYASDVDVVGAPRTFGIGVVTDTGAEQITLDTVVIKDNFFDLNPDPSPVCPLPVGAFDPNPSREDLGDKFADGIIAGNVDAKVFVLGNHFQNTARAGISLVDVLGKAVVSKNVVEPGPTVFNGPFIFGSIGIDVVNGFFNFDPDTHGVVFVRDNDVKCASADCQGVSAGSFFVKKGRAVISNNHIVMDGSEPPALPFAAGISLFLSDSVLARNKIKGRSNFAVLLQDTIGLPSTDPLFDLADDNRVVSNKVKKFTPLADEFFGTPLPRRVHYALFGASNNFLRGRSGRVLDEGENNTIKGGLEVVE